MRMEETLITPIYIAAELGDVAMLKILVDLGFDIFQESQYGQTALHFAARAGRLEVVKMLIGVIDPRLIDTNGMIALHWAATNNHPEVARVLSKTFGTLGIRDQNQHTPLHIACEEHHVEYVRVLLEEGSEHSARDYLRQTPAHLALRRKSRYSIEILQLLANQDGIDLDARDSRGATPLSHCGRTGDVEAAKLLINRSVSPTPRDEFQRTPLHIAMLSGQAEVVRCLLDVEPLTVFAELRVVTEWWNCASKGGDVEILEALAEMKSVGLLPAENVVEILSETIKSANDEACSFLIELISRSIHPISKDVAIRVLMITSKRGLVESSRLLAEIPSVDEMTHLSTTPVESAHVYKNTSIADMLLGAGFTAPDQVISDLLAEGDTEASSSEDNKKAQNSESE